MSAKNIVVLDIGGGRTFTFQKFNRVLTYRNQQEAILYATDGRLLIQVQRQAGDDSIIESSDFTLLAVPLNCALSAVEVIEVDRNENGFSIPLSNVNKEFIVFDNDQIGRGKVLPTYVTIDTHQLLHPSDRSELLQRKETRIQAFAKALQDGSVIGDEWQKLFQYVKICRHYHLPFSAFDNLRASSSSSDLSAKLFFLLLCYTESDHEFVKTCEKMEEELGFKFHWCAFNSFKSAHEWLPESWLIDPQHLFVKAALVVEAKYLMYKSGDWVCNPHFNTEIQQMRARLGEAVINELPTRRPYIKEERKTIIRFSTNLNNLKIMIRCPIAIGLVKCDLYSRDLTPGTFMSDIWHSENHIVRRNIIYCQQIDQEWYDLALKYTIKQLKNEF